MRYAIARYERLHNLNKSFNFSLKGYPILNKVEIEEVPEFIGFNEMLNDKDGLYDKGVHFFLDDYQFERFWNSPERYINKLSKYNVVLTPDFSLYYDDPLPLQQYNTYRNRLLGAYMQSMGIKVMPTISWGTYESFEFCFEGISKGSAVTISNVGAMRNKDKKNLFLEGFYKMIDAISPSKILIFGKEIELNTKIEVVYITNKNVERLKEI